MVVILRSYPATPEGLSMAMRKVPLIAAFRAKSGFTTGTVGMEGDALSNRVVIRYPPRGWDFV